MEKESDSSSAGTVSAISKSSHSDLEQLEARLKSLNGACDQIQTQLVNVFGADLVKAVHDLEVLQEKAKELIQASSNNLGADAEGRSDDHLKESQQPKL